MAAISGLTGVSVLYNYKRLTIYWKVNLPEHTGQADFTSVPLQCPESQGLDHAVDIAGGFGIGECSVGGSLLETVGVLDLALSHRRSGVSKQSKDST